MAVANYMGIDKERYDQGNKFYSQDPYLQGIGLDKPAITFNPSNYDTGITSQYGNNSMYGTPNQGGDSMGATMPTGNFNQKSIGSLIDPYQGQPSFLNNALNKAKDYGLKAFASQMGAQGGAMLGGMIPGGILPILLGAGAGGKFGFDMAGAAGSDPQGLISNFYGNQGNSPTQYMDPETGELVDSIMQGYNINSAFGKGMPAAIQARIDRITNRKAPQTIASGKLLAALRREQNAITGYGKDVEKAREINITSGYGGSDDSAGATGPTAGGAGMGVGGGHAADYQGETGDSFGSESNDSDFSNYS
jgi:hypothetical protein